MSPAPMDLVTVTGDGTFAPPRDGTGERSHAGDDEGRSRLDALVRLRSLLGDDLEDRVATQLYVPAALGTEPADHLLPASLSLLAGTTGDLASYGWRVGPGTSRAWLRARELRERTIEDCRFALLGYEGPLRLTVTGPVTLAAASFLASGERTLADRGAVRDLPVLLAEGIAAQAAALRERVPGARVTLLVREEAVSAVLAGAVPTPSGRDRYRALPVPDLADHWRALLHGLAESAGIPADGVTLAVGASDGSLGAALSAGARKVALAPAGLGTLRDATGRRAWEALAEAREDGVGIELVLDPSRPDRDLDLLAASWRQLGYAERDLAGFTWQAHRRPSGTSTRDLSAPPPAGSLLEEADLVALLRRAPVWAERVSD